MPTIRAFAVVLCVLPVASLVACEPDDSSTTERMPLAAAPACSDCASSVDPIAFAPPVPPFGIYPTPPSARCDDTTCAGCCDEAGECLEGKRANACGTGGARCLPCTGGCEIGRCCVGPGDACITAKECCGAADCVGGRCL